MKSFQYPGLWWLPSNEEQKIAGVATFMGNEPTVLVLHGMFTRDFKPGPIEFSEHPIILGTIENDQQITLFHCQETSFKLGEEEEQKYWADVTFVGAHFTDPQVIHFNKVDAFYNYLPQWAGVFPYRGLQEPFDDVRASTTKGVVTVQVVRNVWERLVRETDVMREAILPETVCVRFEVQEALSLNEWTTQFLAPLQHFISLATQRPNAIVNIVGYVQQEHANPSNSNGSEIPVQITFAPAITPISTKNSTVPGTILFSLQNIATNLSVILDTWLRIADELDSAFRLFFGVLYTEFPLDLQFLLLAQAVEVYQDHRFDKTPFSEEEYQRLMERLLESCTEEHYKEWLGNALRYSNSATFSQQLKNLVAKTYAILHPLLGKNSEKRGDFGRIVYNTRNYLTHHTKELAPHQCSGPINL